MAKHRINYEVLTNLKERLEELGVAWNNVPIEVIRSTWFEQRDYFQMELGLAFCVRCKMPIPYEDVAPGATDMCNYHRERQLEAWDKINSARASNLKKPTFYNTAKSIRNRAAYQRRKQQNLLHSERLGLLGQVSASVPRLPSPERDARMQELLSSMKRPNGDPVLPLKSGEVTTDHPTVDCELDIESFLKKARGPNKDPK